MINLYHGTTEIKAKGIMKHGFQTGKKPNWSVPSREGFVYLSTAYAPFFAMYSSKTSIKGAIVKCRVEDIIDKCYPDDDWLMAALGKPVYTKAELDAVNPEDYRYYAYKSLEQLGSVAVKPQDVQAVGMQPFNMKKLLWVSDPTITPMNYKLMGNYYKALSDWIYEKGTLDGFIEWWREEDKKNWVSLDKLKTPVVSSNHGI